MRGFRARVCMPVLALGLCSCASTSAPPGDAGFAPITELRQLAGCYRNLGDSGGSSPRYLSQLLWPDATVDHARIDTVRVVAEGQDALAVSGEAADQVIESGRLVENDEVRLEAGTVTIRKRAFSSLAAPADNPFIGAGHESVRLGLDPQGNVRLLETSTYAGTAFLIIPAVGRVSSVLRFARAPCS